MWRCSCCDCRWRWWWSGGPHVLQQGDVTPAMPACFLPVHHAAAQHLCTQSAHRVSRVQNTSRATTTDPTTTSAMAPPSQSTRILLLEHTLITNCMQEQVQGVRCKGQVNEGASKCGMQGERGRWVAVCRGTTEQHSQARTIMRVPASSRRNLKLKLSLPPHTKTHTPHTHTSNTTRDCATHSVRPA